MNRQTQQDITASAFLKAVKDEARQEGRAEVMSRARKWLDHMRLCGARDPKFGKCTCGLSDFLEDCDA